MLSTPRTEPILTVTDAIAPEAETAIDGGLARFNQAESGIADARSLAVIATDPATGEVMGGLTGRTSLGLLFIDLFFLPEARRGAGLGGEILRLAEEEAIRRGFARPCSTRSASRRPGSTSATATAPSARSRAIHPGRAACS